jgi:outer membrane protein assembly factor BamA
MKIIKKQYKHFVTTDYSVSTIAISVLLVAFMVFSSPLIAQDKLDNDTIKKQSTFDKFNAAAMKVFKYVPYPMVTYANETGTVFGLVKYDLVRLVKSDTISTPSSFSEMVSFSSKGQFKVVLGTQQFYLQNRVIFKSEVQYVDYPDFILGVGNDVDRNNVEKVVTKRFVFNNGLLFAIDKEHHLYAGPIFNYTNYLNVEFDTSSFFVKEEYPGYKGGISSGIGLGLRYDTRDYRYNATSGFYSQAQIINYGGMTGSDFNYYSYEIDLRKFWNPWLKHVIAAQAFAAGNVGSTPFYSLSLMGGTNRMRGYFLGAIRDKMLMDAQVEYRMPVWNIFGVVGFLSAGRVGSNWQHMQLDGLWYGGGLGLRIMVDPKNRANLRIDFGYGEGGATALVFGFTEAF